MNQLSKFRILGWSIILSMLFFGAQTDGVSAPSPMVKRTWRISGRVLSMQEQPIADVNIKLETEVSVKGRQTMKTDSKGEFRTEVSFESATVTRLQGTLVAQKTDYIEGREILNLHYADSADGIEIILRQPGDGMNQLPLATLVKFLAPQLKANAEKEYAEEARQAEFVRGCEELIDQQHPDAAVLLFTKSIERTPDCLECQLLLGLALMNTESWGGAKKQMEDASIINDQSDVKQAAIPLMKGIVESWRGHVNESVGYYIQVLEIDPKNALALQEMGRAGLAQRNWEVSEQFLNKAILAGAGEEARLLHVRALMELGEVEEAENEMERYAAGRDVKKLSQSARTLNERVQNQLSLLAKGPIQSMITQPINELLQAIPALQGLTVAADQSLLEEILNKTGEGVEAFFQSIPNTASLEQVHQERLRKDGKVAEALDQEFNYIMLAQTGAPGLGIQEYRSTADGNDTNLGGLKQGLMLTSGFASVASLFHPAGRNDADYRYLGKQKLNGREVHVIAFAQKPQTAKMVTRFVTDSKSALALVHGLAWVDVEAFHILQLHTFLLNPLPEVQLQKLSTEIQFQEVSFAGVSRPLWLPKEVQITVDWRRRVLRNLHRYSEFHLFSVESKEERKPVKIPSPPPEDSSEETGGTKVQKKS
jgi:tetratricopeptide (TPR) repeat protein